MKGFSFEMYNDVFLNCFINSSYYANGNLQLSLFGEDPNLGETTHFADITLEQNTFTLNDNEIIVNNKFKPTLVSQLKKLGILTAVVGSCIINNTLLPIYNIDFSKINENCYDLDYLLVA